MKINYTNGTSETVDIHNDAYEFYVDNNQYDVPWILGDNNYMTISYLGTITQLPVSINIGIILPFSFVVIK